MEYLLLGNAGFAFLMFAAMAKSSWQNLVIKLVFLAQGIINLVFYLVTIGWLSIPK